jgi:hypothetical protein
VTGITLGLDTARRRESAMSPKQLPPLDVIRKNIIYDCETGLIKSTQRSKPPEIDFNGYVRVGIEYKKYAGHRIAWALHHGELPPLDMEIDHINGIRDDNRISNLRLVSMSDNMKNKTQYRNNTHGYPGIIFEANSRRVRQWRAQIQVNGKIIKIGSYMCKTAAIFARKRTEAKHGFTQLAGEAKWQLSSK